MRISSLSIPAASNFSCIITLCSTGTIGSASPCRKKLGGQAPVKSLSGEAKLDFSGALVMDSPNNWVTGESSA